MTDNFFAEIRISTFNFQPKGWAFCNSQLIPIQQNTTLFTLMKTTYGGDGRTTFALPDLSGIADMQHGQGPGLSNRDIGQIGGKQTVTLILSEIPSHTHTANDKVAGDNATPTNIVWGTSSAGKVSAIFMHRLHLLP